jgi:hypothetical protein
VDIFRVPRACPGCFSPRILPRFLSAIKSLIVARSPCAPVRWCGSERRCAGTAAGACWARARLPAAWRGAAPIPTRVIDLDNPLGAEHDENRLRKEFTPSERLEIAEAMAAQEREKARERQAQAGPKEGRGKKQSASGKLPEPVSGRIRDIIASRVGWSGRTYEKAKMVAEAAKDNPDAYASLVERMDRTGNVHGTWRRLPGERRQQFGALCAGALAPLPPPCGPLWQAQRWPLARWWTSAGRRILALAGARLRRPRARARGLPPVPTWRTPGAADGALGLARRPRLHLPCPRGLPGAPYTAPPTPLLVRPHKPGGSRFRPSAWAGASAAHWRWMRARGACQASWWPTARSRRRRGGVRSYRSMDLW